MKITTKFNVNEKVCVLRDGKIRDVKIIGINILVDSADNIHVYYSIMNRHVIWDFSSLKEIKENEIFKSKQQLLDSL